MYRDDTIPANDGGDDSVQTRLTAGDSPSEEIVRAVADAKGVDPTALDPLFDVVDPDGLDTLYSDPHVFEENPVVTAFTMASCHVIIQSDGTLFVQDSEDAE